MAPEQAPAGWYQADAGRPRYWDGELWTEHVAYAVGQPPASATVAYARPSVSGAHLAFAWVATVLTGGYMLPWAIAATRRKSNSVAIAVLTALAGWTVVGWFVALVMACGSEPGAAAVPYAPGLAALPPAGWYPQATSGRLEYWDGHAWSIQDR